MKCPSCGRYHHKQNGKIICYKKSCPYSRELEKTKKIEYLAHRGILRFADEEVVE